MNHVLRILALVALLHASAVNAAMHPTCPQVELSTAQVGAPADMQFSLRTIDKHNVLFAEGGITKNTPANLENALKKYKDVEEIWLRSGGGDADAGNRAAQILRKSGIPVRIPGGWWCISACNFLFFGGALRSIDSGGQFGVHMATAVNNEAYQRRIIELEKRGASANLLGKIAEREQSMAMLTADDIDVILRMGISRKLLTEVMYAQRADVFRDDDRDGKIDFDKAATFRCLSRPEMTKYNVINID